MKTGNRFVREERFYIFGRAANSIAARAACLLFAALSICYASQNCFAQGRRLTATDKSDMRQVISGQKNGESRPLDLHDPVQNRFLRRQLEMAGLTPRIAPETFRSLRRALKSPRPASAAKQDTTATGPQAVNIITDIKTNNQQNFVADALSSVPGRTTKTILLLGLYDANGDKIGDVKRTEQFNAGTDARVSAQGTATQAGQLVQAIGSYYYEKDGFPHGGSLLAKSSAVPISITNNDPMIKVTGHTTIVICINRQGAHQTDCDYSCNNGWNCTLTPNPNNNVIFPVKGSIEFPGPIAPIQYDQNGDPTNAFSSIYVAWTVAGGGCPQQSLQGSFFKDPNTVINGNVLSWNLNPAQFGVACYQGTNSVIYSFAVYVTVNGLPVFAYINNTGGTPTDSTKIIPPTTMVVGCLAEGTNILMADKSERRIETFDAGEQIISNPDGRVLRVFGSLLGTEDKPMIRIKTSKGQSVLMTDGHPVVTTRGVALARRLKRGDEVYTPSGTAHITSITREKSDRKVWNLDIGRPEDNVKFTPENTTFFANGILVGDSKMQGYWELKDRQSTKAVLESLPKRWHKDYLNYLREQKRKNQK